MAAFAQFGSELDAATQGQLNRGQRMVEALKQDQYQPMPVERQIVTIFAGTNGYFDSLPVNRVREFEKALLEHIDSAAPEIYRGILEKKELAADAEKKLRALIEAFKGTFAA
jgi:F-type H+-transporting ATPase subunit alpha